MVTGWMRIPRATSFLPFPKTSLELLGRLEPLLGKAGVNIAEWRLGRDVAKKRAVTMINLDSAVPARALTSLRRMSAIVQAQPVRLERDD